MTIKVKRGRNMSERIVEAWQGGGSAGWRVVFWRERDEAVSYWYGTQAECEARANGPEPRASYWHKPSDSGADEGR